MPDEIRTVDYFYIQTANKPGAAANTLQALEASGVNLLAFSGFPSGRKAQLDFVPADSQAFVKAARQAKLKLSPRKSGFLIQGEDRVGAIGSSLRRLANAKINVTAVDAVSSGMGRF
ncbi:MAG TPA: hypothetical protein VIC04_03590, partial [Terriglobia bacterium]